MFWSQTEIWVHSWNYFEHAKCFHCRDSHFISLRSDDSLFSSWSLEWLQLDIFSTNLGYWPEVKICRGHQTFQKEYPQKSRTEYVASYFWFHWTRKIKFECYLVDFLSFSSKFEGYIADDVSSEVHRFDLRIKNSSFWFHVVHWFSKNESWVVSIGSSAILSGSSGSLVSSIFLDS